MFLLFCQKANIFLPRARLPRDCLQWEMVMLTGHLKHVCLSVGDTAMPACFLCWCYWSWINAATFVILQVTVTLELLLSWTSDQWIFRGWSQIFWPHPFPSHLCFLCKQKHFCTLDITQIFYQGFYMSKTILDYFACWVQLCGSDWWWWSLIQESKAEWVWDECVTEPWLTWLRWPARSRLLTCKEVASASLLDLPKCSSLFSGQMS